MTIRALLRDQRGSAMVMFPAFILVAAGIASLAVDMGHLYGLRGKLQHTADAAVLAAVGDLPDEDAARTTAIDLATANMSTAEHGTVLASADVVPGNWDSDTRIFTPAGAPINALQVVTRRSQANGNAAGLFFARVLGFNEVDMDTSAIAISTPGGDSCVIALDPSLDDALRVGGSADVTMGCGARVNSNGNRAVRANGGGCMTASLIYSGGGSQGSCFDPTVEEDMAPMADPLASLIPPVYAGCDYPDLVEVTTDTTLTPGVYCGGIYIYGSANVEFDPGTYILEGRGLEITGSGYVEGTGVTFYIPPTVVGISTHHHLTPTTSVHFAGSANIELSAATSVDYENVLIYQDAGVSPDLDLVFNGGADMILDGTLYAPNNHLRFAGNNDGSGATSIVARTVYFTGTSSFGANSETALYGPGGAGGSNLVR